MDQKNITVGKHLFPRSKFSIMAYVGGSPQAMKLRKWDSRTHDFIKDISRAENNFQEGYRRKEVNSKVKHFWDPLSARHKRPLVNTGPLKMPHLDSARTTNDSKPNGKRVVKLLPCVSFHKEPTPNS